MKGLLYNMLIVTSILALFSSSLTVSNSTLKIEVTNLKNNTGQIALALYNNSKGFPEKETSMIKKVLLIPENNIATGTITGLAPGNYAIAMLHDENKNTVMDKNIVGIPKEGFGFSKNPKIGFSAPEFSECSFKVDQGTKELSLKMFYF